MDLAMIALLLVIAVLLGVVGARLRNIERKLFATKNPDRLPWAWQDLVDGKLPQEIPLPSEDATIQELLVYLACLERMELVVENQRFDRSRGGDVRTVDNVGETVPIRLAQEQEAVTA